MPSPPDLAERDVAARAVAEPAAPARGFRRDVQGLRAVAVALVLAFHAGLPVPGGFVGVDVFFVVSGFLITGLIADEVARTGRLRLGRFYARRARRLLPAAALALTAVVVATLVWLPVTRWREIAGDVVATALYVVNWRLADRSVDYLAEGAAASPVQHFWSLAVEEQFYVIWPLLVVALVALARMRGRRVTRRALVVGVAVVAWASVLWSVTLTDLDPARAYFVTTTRVWELAAGALLALLAHRVVRAPAGLLRAGGWAGLALLLLAAVLLDGGTPFPGTAALLPVGGTVLVLAAGLAGPGLRPLTAGVLQPVGAASYSLYLWHWPAVVVATSLAGRGAQHACAGHRGAGVGGAGRRVVPVRRTAAPHVRAAARQHLAVRAAGGRVHARRRARRGGSAARSAEHVGRRTAGCAGAARRHVARTRPGDGPGRAGARARGCDAGRGGPVRPGLPSGRARHRTGRVHVRRPRVGHGGGARG
ncbi:acyltransferase [Cellulomonas sp.]|uniref:acyltransferase family protein n=1 Tax=Cellulomonas sp. TaxID=40001 RepID=UPI0025876139|nr:acyltransferase [Cellulomonas sp.]MCR6689490.1 acyltransferase [Cellulomonas sp.]